MSKCVAFESTLLNFYLRKPLLRWTFQHFAMAAEKKGGNGTNKKKPALAGSRTQVSATLGPRAYIYIYIYIYICYYINQSYYFYYLLTSGLASMIEKYTLMLCICIYIYTGI